MEYFWTSKNPIKGLRHFVLLNVIEEKDKTFFLLVSVLDAEVNLKILREDLINGVDWYRGWVKLPKTKSITQSYRTYKSTNREKERSNMIFIDEESPFNIS